MKQRSSKSQGILDRIIRRTAFSDICNWLHCALESLFEVVALCKAFSLVCNAAVSLLYRSFHGIKQSLCLNILLCTALQANVFVIVLVFFLCVIFTVLQHGIVPTLQWSSGTAVSCKSWRGFITRPWIHPSQHFVA